MTFVPESEVRSFYQEQLDVLGGKPLAEIRDEVRAYLAERKFNKELDEWFDQQVAEGRVEMIGSASPGTPAGSERSTSSEMP